MFPILTFLWFIRTAKVILFYLYLWQLKEYRILRFLDHFRTEKGKNLLFSKLIFLKFILVLAFFVCPLYFLLFLIILYFSECAKVLIDFFKKTLKKPILTKKAVFLISAALILEISVLLILFLGVKEIIWGAFWLLVFDILTPVIISLIVFIFQPLTVLWRNKIIKKAKKKRAEFKDLLVIGITGSYGKTSTKEFLATILSEKFNVLKTKEHQNTEVGVSQCILNDLQPGHEIFICEMGAYQRGEIKLLADIARPKIGILTGINEQHLATFGSQKNIIKAKYELIESLPEDGLAIFNGDSPYFLELYQKTMIKKRIYSLQSSISRAIAKGKEEGLSSSLSGKPPDIWAHNIRMEKDSVSFRAYLKDDSADFKVKVLGVQNVLNILGAVVVAKELGMSLEEIARVSQKIEPGQSGMQIKKGINGLNVIDATYSANPDGVIAHLDYLKTWPGKKVIVMPCLIELGSSSKEVHRRIGQKIGEVCDLSIITTKERFKEIKEGAGGKTIFLENPKKIFEKIKSIAREGNVVLLESRVPGQLIKKLTIPN
jgi:UDP-N-acetylmuramoyl-tripeptide--D-alanyl-D-alanine ligase